MIVAYIHQNNKLAEIEHLNIARQSEPPVWVDLLNPTVEEDALVEQYLKIAIPSKEEMEEIELSSRLYHEDGAEFMTMTALIHLGGDEPAKTPITFILKGQTLVTVRYAEPKPFMSYIARADKSNAVSCHSGEAVMLGLIDSMIDRMADALERVGVEIDAISRQVFRNKSATATKKTRDLQSIIEQIGRKGDLLTMMLESLVTVARISTYHAALDGVEVKLSKESRTRLKTIQRDTSSLRDHAMFLSNKITFLLDATLGLINLEQNQIIKIFSIAAVVFLPPTLVASSYGMNFDFMPELKFQYGYPCALLAMVVSAIIPLVYFKRRGWL